MGAGRRGLAGALAAGQAASGGAMGRDAWLAHSAGAQAGGVGLALAAALVVAAALGILSSPYRHRAWNGVVAGTLCSAWLAVTGPRADGALALGGLALALAALAACWRSVPVEFGGTGA